MNITENNFLKWDLIIKPNIPDIKGTFILDIGCKNGWLVQKAIDAGVKHIVGIDYNREYIEAARRNLKKYSEKYKKNIDNVVFDVCNVITEDFQKYADPLPEKRFDIIFMLNILYWLEGEENVIRILKKVKDITHLVVVQGKYQKKENGYSGTAHYPAEPEDVIKCLEKAGWDKKNIRVHDATDPETKRPYYRPLVIANSMYGYCSSRLKRRKIHFIDIDKIYFHSTSPLKDYGIKELKDWLVVDIHGTGERYKARLERLPAYPLRGFKDVKEYVKKAGLDMDPITLTNDYGIWSVAAGKHRYVAARLLGMKKIPCYLMWEK